VELKRHYNKIQCRTRSLAQQYNSTFQEAWETLQEDSYGNKKSAREKGGRDGSGSLESAYVQCDEMDILTLRHLSFLFGLMFGEKPSTKYTNTNLKPECVQTFVFLYAARKASTRDRVERQNASHGQKLSSTI